MVHTYTVCYGIIITDAFMCKEPFTVAGRGRATFNDALRCRAVLKPVLQSLDWLLLSNPLFQQLTLCRKVGI